MTLNLTLPPPLLLPLDNPGGVPDDVLQILILMNKLL